MLEATRYEDLRLPFGALATELLTYHGALFTSGALHPTLLASAAIPGVYPPVEINGVLYVDGALTAYVPMDAALRMGAGSLVVLDAGGSCHRNEPPRNMAEMFFLTMQATLRQRVWVEASKIAAERPVLYLPTPCAVSRGTLDFSAGTELIELAFKMSTLFLESAPIPVPEVMCGAPHFHDDVPVRLNTRMAKA
jgi:NTE family protein